jgi:hypothetical protein
MARRFQGGADRWGCVRYVAGAESGTSGSIDEFKRVVSELFAWEIVQVYVLGEQGKYGSFESYTVEDTLTVGIMPELTIAVETIFAI